MKNFLTYQIINNPIYSLNLNLLTKISNLISQNEKIVEESTIWDNNFNSYASNFFNKINLENKKCNSNNLLNSISIDSKNSSQNKSYPNFEKLFVMTVNDNKNSNVTQSEFNETWYFTDKSNYNGSENKTLSINKIKSKKFFIKKNSTKITYDTQIFESQFKIACEIYPKISIGSYSWDKRIKKILKFKLKKLKQRKIKPIMTKYIGRSKIASTKIRIRGRFVKKAIENKEKIVFKISHNEKSYYKNFK